MRKLFILFSLVSFSCIVGSNGYGNQYWAKTYGEAHWDFASAIRETTDGGYIIAGYTLSFGSPYEAWLLKLDNMGNIAWEKRYGENEWEEAHYIQQTSDGGYFMMGCYDCDSNQGNTWIVKFDSFGGITWQKTYPAIFHTMVQTQGGEYVLAGHYNGVDHRDVCLLKLDSTGTISWQRAYGTGDPFPPLLETAYSIQQTADEGYIVAGTTTVQGCVGCGKVLILRLDSSGNLLWQQTYRGSNSIAHSILQTEDTSGYILVGSMGDNSSGYDALVLKLDNNGAISWQKAYDSSDNEIALSIKQISGAGYIIVGSYYSTSSGDYEGMWLLEIDSSGVIARQKMCEMCNADAFDQTGEGGYIFAGTTFQFGAGMGDMVALKL